MMSTDAEHAEKTRKRPRRTGCLLPLLVYMALLVPAYYLSIPPEVTEDFSAHARSFSIAGVTSTADGAPAEYRALTLARLEAGKVDRTGLTFLLPEKNVTIDVGDIHRVAVIEDHGEWQLIEYHYANSHTSTSIYRAYRDRIEPVSYQLTSSMVQALLAIILIVPAYIAVGIYIAVRNWKDRRARAEGD